MGPDYYVNPTANTSTAPSRKTLLLGGGLMAAILLGVILLLSSGGTNISTQAQHLTLRLGTLQTLIDDTTLTRNLKNEDLSKIVTDFSLTLQTDINTLTPLLASDIPEKYSESIVAAETDVTTAKELEEAGFNNRLDEAYAEVVVKKIISIRALLAETMPVADGQLKQALGVLDKHLLEQGSRIQKLKL